MNSLYIDLLLYPSQTTKQNSTVTAVHCMNKYMIAIQIKYTRLLNIGIKYILVESVAMLTGHHGSLQ